MSTPSGPTQPQQPEPQWQGQPQQQWQPPAGQPQQQWQPPAGQPQQQWQPSNPPAPPAPAPKQKSWFARHKILTALLALFLLGGLASALGGGGDSSTDAATGETSPAASAAASSPAKPSSATPAKKPEPAATAGIGTKVRDGKFEFTVTKVEAGGKQVGDSSFGEKAQGSFHLVHLTISNIGDKAQMMFDSNQKVKDAQGREFEPNSMAAILLPDNDIWMKDINPGNTLNGVLVYDMPDGSTPTSIELHDSMFSGGVTVSLK
ncbi:MAG: DUF4352 domain-containing protein [Micrococcales bacterium]|nr:DUF4352 domain-containing protein [Micrococcales bacterium]